MRMPRDISAGCDAHHSSVHQIKRGDVQQLLFSCTGASIVSDPVGVKSKDEEKLLPTHLVFT